MTCLNGPRYQRRSPWQDKTWTVDSANSIGFRVSCCRLFNCLGNVPGERENGKDAVCCLYSRPRVRSSGDRAFLPTCEGGRYSEGLSVTAVA